MTATIPVGTSPGASAINPVINKIYVANSRSGNVAVIDGAANNTTTVAAGTDLAAVAVNPATTAVLRSCSRPMTRLGLSR